MEEKRIPSVQRKKQPAPILQKRTTRTKQSSKTLKYPYVKPIVPRVGDGRREEEDILLTLHALHNMAELDDSVMREAFDFLDDLTLNKSNAFFFVQNGGLNCLSDVILFTCNKQVKKQISASEIETVSTAFCIMGKLLTDPRVAQAFIDKGGLTLLNDIMKYFDHYEAILNAGFSVLAHLSDTIIGRQCMMHNGVVETATYLIEKHPQYAGLMQIFCGRNFVPILIGLPHIEEIEEIEERSSNIKINRNRMTVNELKELNIELENEQFAERYISQGKVENILENMQECINDINILCESLKVIISCSKVATKEVFKALDEIGVVECVVQCMNAHPNHMTLQHNGLLTLQILVQHGGSLIAKSLCQPPMLQSAVNAVHICDGGVVVDPCIAQIFAQMVIGLLDDDNDIDDVNTTMTNIRDLLLASGVVDTLELYPAQTACILALEKIDLLRYKNFNFYGAEGESESESDNIKYNYDSVYSDVGALIENTGKIISHNSRASFSSSSSFSSLISLELEGPSLTVGTLFDAFDICYPAQEYYFIELNLEEDDLACEIIEYKPEQIIEVIYLKYKKITRKQIFAIYKLIIFCGQQILSEKWGSKESEAWIRLILNENIIIYNLSPNQADQAEQHEASAASAAKGIEFISMQGLKSLVWEKTKIKTRKLKSISVGIERLATNMSIEIKLSNKKNETKTVCISDFGVIDVNGVYSESFVHNHQYIDRDSVIKINVLKTNKKSVEVQFFHIKNDTLISESTVIPLKFIKATKSIKMVAMVRQMDGNGIYYK